MNLGFAEHPEILPKLFHHIFEAFVSRSDHEALQDAFDKQKAEFKDLKALVDRFLSVMNDGGNGGGGVGGGGVIKKKQRRGKGAAKEAEVNVVEDEETCAYQYQIMAICSRKQTTFFSRQRLTTVMQWRVEVIDN